MVKTKLYMVQTGTYKQITEFNAKLSVARPGPVRNDKI